MKSYDHLNFTRASVVQFRVSLYVMRLNLTFELNLMTIWISQELPLLNFERLDMWFAWIGHPCEKLWPFEFLKSFRCSISSVLIYYAPESDLRVVGCGPSYSLGSFAARFIMSFFLLFFFFAKKHLIKTHEINQIFFPPFLNQFPHFPSKFNPRRS